MFSTWSLEKKVVWLALSTLYIEALWTLHPDALLNYGTLPEYSLFPLNKDVTISWPTYISMFCKKSTALIIVRIWWLLLPKYRLCISALFVILALQFFQFFIDYNKAYIWVFIGNHKLDVDLTLAKLTIPIGILIYQQTWKEK